MRALPFPDPPLGDGVVALRPKRHADAEPLAALLQDPEIPRWTTVQAGYTIADARLWIERSEHLRLDGAHLSLLVVEAGDAHALLGTVGLIVERPPAAEIGYLTGAAARGRGVAGRAVTLLRDWAVRALGFERIELVIHGDNAPSRRVAEKAGFSDSGERRDGRGAAAAPGSHRVYAWDPAAPGRP